MQKKNDDDRMCVDCRWFDWGTCALRLLEGPPAGKAGELNGDECCRRWESSEKPVMEGCYDVRPS